MTVTTKWALGLAVLLAALLQPPLAWGQLRTHSGAAKSSFEHPKELEQRVFQFTNEARRKNGLPPLEPDQTLMTLARGKSDDMIKRHYFSHPDPEGKTIKERYAEVKPTRGGDGRARRKHLYRREKSLRRHYDCRPGHRGRLYGLPGPSTKYPPTRLYPFGYRDIDQG